MLDFHARSTLLCLTTVVIAGLGTLACGGDSGPEDPGFEALPNDSVTAAAAADVLLDAIAAITAHCAASSAIDCPDGVPGAPIPLSVTRTRLALTYVGGSFRWDVAADLVLRSPTFIPVTIPIVGKCSVDYDTRAGTDSIITVSFSENYVPIDSQFGGQKIVFTDPIITGLTTDDVTLTGLTACGIANPGLPFFISILTQQLATHTGSLCGAGGSELFRECPEIASVAWARRRASAT